MAQRSPWLLPLVKSLGKTPLTTEQREALRGVVSDEFVGAGLGADDEPTEYGLRLEHLLDLLGHL